MADIGKLFAALAANSGGKTAVIIAALPQAVKLKLTAGPKFDYDIIASVATPVKSLYQIDAIGLRTTLWATWGLRAAGHASTSQERRGEFVD